MGEIKTALVILGTGLAFGLLFTVALVGGTAWARDADGAMAVWLTLSTAPLIHEMAHRAVFRRAFVRAELATTTHHILGFGGAVRVPDGVPKPIMVKGALAGPLATLSQASLSLALSPLVKPLSLAALMLAMSVVASGLPFTSDGRHLTNRVRLALILGGLALSTASLFTAAYLLKHG